MKSLEGMARWVPRNGFQKAGVGAYRMEADHLTAYEPAEELTSAGSFSVRTNIPFCRGGENT